ncbi:MAG: DUF2911 domain-containing protein [Bacteroidetes bacterium]|nr:DUF2911 domain-containing protein [Bacteroidota bacterium]MBI3482043.1 DUF2911 domain-containing protein [Bacteroidota bacterium]
MKNTISLLVVSLVALFSMTTYAQKDKSKRPSPPAKAEGTIDGAKIVIDYSTPFVKGRKIFGALEPYGKVWRTGANEATSFEVDKNIKIEGKELPKGKYTLYSIPGEKEWVVIFNKTTGQWGTEYSESTDALRVTVKTEKAAKLVEQFNIAIEGNKIVFRWENSQFAVAVKG